MCVRGVFSLIRSSRVPSGKHFSQKVILYDNIRVLDCDKFMILLCQILCLSYGTSVIQLSSHRESKTLQRVLTGTVSKTSLRSGYHSNSTLKHIKLKRKDKKNTHIYLRSL